VSVHFGLLGRLCPVVAHMNHPLTKERHAALVLIKQYRVAPDYCAHQLGDMWQRAAVRAARQEQLYGRTKRR